MPYWAVIIVILVLVVGYYLLSQQGRERRRDRVGVDFAKTPGFYANQSYTDVQGQSAIGIDDRGRRVAVARKHVQPRTRVYSFSHIVSAEVLQDERVIAVIRRGGPPDDRPAYGPRMDDQPPAPVSGLFGSTGGRPGVVGLPQLTQVAGQLTRVAVRVTFSNGDQEDAVLLRFYEGKPINVEGVAGEKAFAEAKMLLGSLDVAIKRAATPPAGPATPRTPVR